MTLTIDGVTVLGRLIAALDANGNVITNIGNAGTDFTAAGGLTLAGDLLVDGGDIGITADTNLLGLAVNTLTVRGQADIEGYSVFGNGGALNAAVTMTIDRDFTTSVQASHVRMRGIITANGGTANMHYWENISDGIVINSGGVHSDVGTMILREPNITAISGSVTNAYTLRILNAPTEGDNNYALWVDDGKTQLDGELEVDGAFNHDGSTVGFFGTTPQSKPTSVAVDASGIHAALVTLGLIAGP